MGLFSDITFANVKEQFVSLNLCSDRLLIELARPEQIAAQSRYSINTLMMLDKINENKPILEPRLTDLLPYLDKTILVNERFYPQLVADLRKLGAKVVAVNDNPQTPEDLFSLIKQLGKLTGNEQQAIKLVQKLATVNFKLHKTQTNTLLLSDTGIADLNAVQNRVLLELLGLTPIKGNLTAQNFSFEKALLSQPNWLISITDKNGYNEQAEVLSHPIWQNLFKNRPLATIPLKYTYCFDHGLWQGVELIYNQLR